MKLSMKKVFSIAMAGIAFLLFIFTFIPAFKISGSSYGLWSSGLAESLMGFKIYAVGGLVKPIILTIALFAIMAIYLLNMFGVLKEKWVKYANYAVGFVAFTYLNLFFGNTKVLFVALWFDLFLSLGLAAVSVLWDFASDEPFKKGGAPIVGYDPQTGKPIYAQPMGYDPQTG